MNEMRAEIYRRLMEAQERIAHTLYKRDVSHDDVLAALDAVDEELSEAQRREDLYLSALEHYVEALGGRIEIRAVFGEDEILVRRAPEKGGS
jgi:replicative DNA helicase